jgi:hypothetical protein
VIIARHNLELGNLTKVYLKVFIERCKQKRRR